MLTVTVLCCFFREIHTSNPESSMSETSMLYQLTSPQLIEMPYLVQLPVAPVHFSRSEQARSMKLNLAARVSKSVNISVVCCSFLSSGICEQTGRKLRVSHSCFTKPLQLLW